MEVRKYDHTKKRLIESIGLEDINEYFLMLKYLEMKMITEDHDRLSKSVEYAEIQILNDQVLRRFVSAVLALFVLGEYSELIEGFQKSQYYQALINNQSAN